MPASEQPPPTGLIAKLLTEGYRFDFFQALRLLEQWYADRAPVGQDANPHQEVVRLESHASLEFPASQIYDVKPAADATHPARMSVTFFGLNGPLGALPQHYTEILLERLTQKDRTLLDFLNLFNHRLLSLFFRAWEKYHFWIAGERALRQERLAFQAGAEAYRSFVLDRLPHLDPLGQMLLSLIGLGSPSTRYRLAQRDELQARTEIADQAWRFYAGLLAQRHRNAIGLENILRDFLSLPARVLPLCGRWLQLEPADRTSLTLNGNTSLGINTVAGQKVWEVQGKFRLQFGPLHYDQFCSLLPIGSAYRPCSELTRFYVGQQLDFDFELLLYADEIPPLRCGDRKGIGPRLGWNTWLYNRGLSTKAASVTLQVRDEPG